MEHRCINDIKRKNRWNIIAMVICLTVLTGCADSTINNESPKADIGYMGENHELEDAFHILLSRGQCDIFTCENTIYELICEETKEDYLQRHGVKDISPICFPRPGGQLGAELYFDKETGRGFGLKYEETEAGTELLGFEIPGYQEGLNWTWNYPNPYSTKIAYCDETYAKADRLPSYVIKNVTDYEEVYEYGLNGKISAYKVTGFVDKGAGNVEKEEIFKVIFSYREDGSLKEKKCWLNPYVSKNCVNSKYCSFVCEEQYYVYDELERLIYASLQGEGEYYFCYEEDAMTPYAYLEPHLLFCNFYRLEEKDYSYMDVPEGGVDAFLCQAGLTKQDLFCEYQWHNESSIDTVIWSHDDICLTLYYDKEKEVGCGYFEYPGESFSDMEGFMFKGCEKLECKEADTYAVYADYHDGKTNIYRIPLDELFQFDSWQYDCKYDNDRLMYIWLYGTNRDTERVYIYDKDSDYPSYCLNLVWDYGITLFEFVP